MEKYLVFVSVLVWIALIRLLNYKAVYFHSRVKDLIHWFHAMTFEILIFFAGFFVRPLAYLTSQKNFCGIPSGRPILLIHGYLHDSSAWIYLKRKLAAEGLGPIYTINLFHPFKSIKQYAEIIKQKTKMIEEETGRNDLILIGHSMGGLVSSWYATKVADLNKVIDVITIGSPLQGTYVAYIALGPNGSEMRYNSEFVNELQREISNNKKVRFHHVGTKTDQLVIPSSSSWVGNCLDKQFVVDDLGHVSLLFSPRVSEKITEWIRSVS